MLKDEFISKVIEKVGDDLPTNSKGDVNRALTGRVVDGIFEVISDALVNGQKVSIAGFGTFDVTERSARVCKNIHTGENINVPATVVPRFKPGATLKRAVKGE